MDYNKYISELNKESLETHIGQVKVMVKDAQDLLAQREDELKQAVEALKNYAVDVVEAVQEKAEEVVEVVKEEVKKAAPKKPAAKKAATKKEEVVDETAPEKDADSDK
jgi:hypothetical protein